MNKLEFPTWLTEAIIARAEADCESMRQMRRMTAAEMRAEAEAFMAAAEPSPDDEDEGAW